jgi:hypothetical protein
MSTTSRRTRRRIRDRLQRPPRRRTFNIDGNSKTVDGFEAEREWARAYWSALAAHHTSVYVSFLMDEGEQRIRQAYGDAKYERLKALKRAYDPTSFFRLIQNIPPD